MVKDKENIIKKTLKNNKKVLTIAGVTGATVLGAFATKKAYDLHVKNLIQNTIDKIKSQN